MNKYFLIFLIVLLGLVSFLIWGGLRGEGYTNSALETFAKCLKEKGIVIYGADSCSWCQKEKANFKGAWRFINYIDCSKNPKDCLALGIEATPAWIFADGKRLTGYQGLEKLAQESGCELPK